MTTSEIVSLIFSGVVAITTVVYAILTWRLVDETRRLRLVQTEPNLEITVESFEYAINIVRLRIRNVGLGPAYGLRFASSVVKGGDVARQLLAEFTASGFFTTGLRYLGPGEHRLSLYTDMAENGAEKCECVLAFEVLYRNAKGVPGKVRAEIDMAEQKRDYQLGTPPAQRVAVSLESIQRDLHNLATGFKRLRVDAFSSDDRAREKLERQSETQERSQQGENARKA